MCLRCQLAPKETCKFCLSASGALLETSSGVWSHKLCSEIATRLDIIEHDQSHSQKICKTKNSENRTDSIYLDKANSKRCLICGKIQGLTIRCRYQNCQNNFHGNCGLRSGALSLVGQNNSLVELFCDLLYCPVHFDIYCAFNSPSDYLSEFPFPKSRLDRQPFKSHRSQFRSSDFVVRQSTICNTVEAKFGKWRIREIPKYFWRYWAFKRLRSPYHSYAPNFNVEYSKRQNQNQQEMAQNQKIPPISRKRSLSMSGKDFDNNYDSHENLLDPISPLEFQKIRDIRSQFEKIRLVLDLCKKREKLKLTSFEVGEEIFLTTIKESHS
eukprot:c21421_g1_i2.p1 GENE.c21421_g1_i2~~c21421_g1_i2.p1  ORF type:complete len:326 (+),score=45.99 c21421_g1_i2:228-1205(+)